MSLSVAHGDRITNMLQVFWVLLLLAITKAKVGDVVGYCAIAMVVGGGVDHAGDDGGGIALESSHAAPHSGQVTNPAGSGVSGRTP